MENILDGLVKLDAYTVNKIIKLNLNQGFGVFISTPDVTNELLRLNYKFVNTAIPALKYWIEHGISYSHDCTH